MLIIIWLIGVACFMSFIALFVSYVSFWDFYKKPISDKALSIIVGTFKMWFFIGGAFAFSITIVNKIFG